MEWKDFWRILIQFAIMALIALSILNACVWAAIALGLIKPS